MKQINTTNKPINKEDLKPIIECIERFYDRNVLLLTEWIDRAIYMLTLFLLTANFLNCKSKMYVEHYLVSKECLMKAYFNNQNWVYEDFY